MKNYPIIKVTGGVVPEMIHANVADLALQLKYGLKESKFMFSQFPSEQDLLDRHKYLKNGLKNNVEIKNSIDYGPILAYFNYYSLIEISDPRTDEGLIEIVDNKLIYNKHGVPIDKQRDAVHFYSPVTYFVAKNNKDIVNEFLEKGFSLYRSKYSNYGRKLPKNPLESFGKLEKISIGDIK